MAEVATHHENICTDVNFLMTKRAFQATGMLNREFIAALEVVRSQTASNANYGNNRNNSLAIPFLSWCLVPLSQRI